MIRTYFRKFSTARALYSAARAGLIELDEGVTFAPSLQIKLHGLRVLQLRVGSHTHLDGRLVVRGDGFVEIGRHCSFRAGTYIGSVVGVDIGSHVFGAEGVFISDNNNHPVEPFLRQEMTRAPIGSYKWSWTADGVHSAPVVVEDNVWLGRNCALLKGVHVGRDSVIALGAVVIKDVPAGAVAAGNPVCVVKTFPTLPC